MKKTLLILGGIALVCALLVFRLIFNQQSNFLTERQWFVKSVRYEFSARVDTIWMFNVNAARLRCVLTEGDPQIHREDSLKRQFNEHDMLYLIYKRRGDSITFVLPGHASKVAIGDSLRVSSKRNSIQFFRKGKLVASDSITMVLTGYGTPSFLRKKK
jgi:hypothetical protein